MQSRLKKAMQKKQAALHEENEHLERAMLLLEGMMAASENKERFINDIKQNRMPHLVRVF